VEGREIKTRLPECMTMSKPGKGRALSTDEEGECMLFNEVKGWEL